MPDVPEVFDVAVIGAGFGGLGAALTLAERGAKVVLCEALRYPGGCASTFTRGGYAFDAGATLLSGLGEGQLFARWQQRHGLDLAVQWLDPVVELRAPGLHLAVPRDRDVLAARFADIPGAPRDRLASFFALQHRVADALWPLFDDPTLLPPLDAATVLRHARRGLAYAPVLRVLGRPLGAVLADHGLDEFAPLRTYLDAVCQITVQCSAAEAEAPFALAAIDYFFRGTAHLRGGVGVLATQLLEAFARAGGTVMLSNAVRSLGREDGVHVLHSRRGPLRARSVVANVLPQALATLTGEALAPATQRLADDVARGWGAAMLYLGVRAEADAPPRHLELVDDAARPFVEGNHVFVSASGADEARAPAGQCAVTASTHVALPRGASNDAVRAAMERATESMRATLARRAPELWSERVHELTASPRTFERFTRRPLGAVGGAPRRAGLAAYRSLGPHEAAPGVWLVGDSVFPGQSALAAAVGGLRTASVLR